MGREGDRIKIVRDEGRGKRGGGREATDEKNDTDTSEQIAQAISTCAPEKMIHERRVETSTTISTHAHKEHGRREG